MKLSVAPLLLAAACVVPDDATVTSVEQDLKCDDWMCGTNSPNIANYGFWDLQRFGLKNKQGFAIDSFSKLGKPYQLNVKNGRFIGEPMSSADPVLVYDALIGSQIYLSRDGHVAFLIEIVGVETTQYWANIGAPVELETYLLKWGNVSGGHLVGQLQDLCSAASSKSDLGMNGYHTTVFEGERIDAQAKTIAPILDLAWFNLGCAGSALAKLQLIGHTEAAKANGYNTTILERQTALKMITADYTGKGTAFTIAGQPLDWMDDRHTLSYQTTGPTLEARWTPYGVSCLSVPRVVANPSPAANAAFPNGVQRAIKAAFGGVLPPPCTGSNVGVENHHLITANPPPLP